jgi:AraC-like DNA-binding protein
MSAMATRKPPPPIRPLRLEKGSQIRWWAFEYYAALKRVRRHLLQHITESLSLGVAADIACLERTYFSAYFRQRTGVNFKYWVDFERIWHAATLLHDMDSCISRVAMECGFSDRSFSRTFKRITGLSPYQFRNHRKPLQPTPRRRALAKSQ